MASTYTDLKVELQATGENDTTWGTKNNANLVALEEAVAYSADVPFSSANVTLSFTDTSATQAARSYRLRCTGTTGGARNLVVPTVEKPYVVKNECADAITVKTTAGTGIAVPAGKTMLLYTDGTNVVDAITALSSLTLASALPVTSGGTGVTTSTGSGNNVLSASPTFTGTVTAATVVASGGLYATGSSTVPAGVSVYAAVTASEGYLDAYNGTSLAFAPLNIRSSLTEIEISGTNRLVVNSTGAAVTGTLSTAATGGPLTVNSTNSNGNKIILQDAGVAKGYVGATGTGAFLADNAGTTRLAVTTSGADVTGGLTATGNTAFGDAGTDTHIFTGGATFSNGITVTTGTTTNGQSFAFSSVPLNYADDAAAAAGGISVGQIYRNGSVLMVRVA